MQRDLIICKSCAAFHEPTEAKRIVRFTCDHCGKEYDTENNTVRVTWSSVHAMNVIRFVLFPACTAEHAEWLHPVQLKDEPAEDETNH